MSVHLKAEHGGCWNVQHFADPKPAAFDFDWKPGAWRGVRVVAAEKAYFHDTPDGGTRRKAFVVEGDALRVYETRADWVHVEYASGDRKARATKGWIQAGDLYPDTPPPGTAKAK